MKPQDTGRPTGLRGLARSLFGPSTSDEALELRRESGAPVVVQARGVGEDDILAPLRAWTCEISDEELRVEDLDPDLGIFDEGYVDSMSYVELLARIEERWGVAVPDDQVVGSTLRDLARYVAQEMDG